MWLPGGAVRACVIAVFASVFRAPPDIPLLHEWMAPPAVVLCLDSPVMPSEMLEAMKWTSEHGAEWGGLGISDCMDIPEPGVVRVHMMPDDAPDFIAGATGIATLDGTALVGYVYLRNSNQHVLRHELLHVQGLDHVERYGHIMNPTVENGGPSTAGIERAMRKQWGR